MRLCLLILFGSFCGLFSLVLGSYEYATHLDSYPAAPVHAHQPAPAAHNAGSYYHYHVPLVGQQQQPHYHHPPPQQDNHLHYLLLPLLLLLALPLLFLPLLPLLLLPIGLSLLALLMPMMMMGMMMMMMMMGGSPTMMRRSLDGSSEMRTLGELLMGDMSSLVSKYARSIDVDKCPERIACEIGSAAFPESASRTIAAKAFMNYIVDNAIPKGRTKRLIRQYREALWEGSKSGNCSLYHCQPTIRMYDEPKAYSTTISKGKQRNNSSGNSTSTSTNSKYYSSPYQQTYVVTPDPNSKLYNYTNINKNDDLSAAAAYYNYYGQNVEDNEVRASNSIYSAFGTPVVKA